MKLQPRVEEFANPGFLPYRRSGLDGRGKGRDVALERVLRRGVSGWAHAIVGACERLAIWRASDPAVTAEHATQYLMDLAWTGLAAACEPNDR